MADNVSPILMTNYLVTNTEMTAVADAIRAKGGTSESLAWPDGYKAAVEAIQTGGVGFDMSVEPNQVKLLVDVPESDKVIYVAFLQSVANSATIDWGDGNIDTSGDTVGKDIYEINRESHTYSEAGIRVITITDISGGVTLWGQYEPGSHILSWNPTNIPITNNQNAAAQAKAYKARRLKEISIGESIKIGMDALTNLPTIYNSGRFTQDGKLVRVSGIFNSEITIQDGVEEIPDYGVSSEYAERITFPESIRKIGNRGLTASTLVGGCMLFDFTATTLIDGEFPIVCSSNKIFPTMTNTNAKILFATQEIAEKAKAATNWASYAAFIHYVGEETT